MHLVRMGEALGSFPGPEKERGEEKGEEEGRGRERDKERLATHLV